MGERRKFTREFKLEAVQAMLSGQKSITALSEELGIRRNVLQRWRDEFKADPEQAFPGNGQLKADAAELERLKRELRRVTNERDILKKALAIFGNEQK